jgi:hypothetical protein
MSDTLNPLPSEELSRAARLALVRSLEGEDVELTEELWTSSLALLERLASEDERLKMLATEGRALLARERSLLVELFGSWIVDRALRKAGEIGRKSFVTDAGAVSLRTRPARLEVLHEDALSHWCRKNLTAALSLDVRFRWMGSRKGLTDALEGVLSSLELATLKVEPKFDIKAILTHCVSHRVTPEGAAVRQGEQRLTIRGGTLDGEGRTVDRSQEVAHDRGHLRDGEAAAGTSGAVRIPVEDGAREEAPPPDGG